MQVLSRGGKLVAVRRLRQSSGEQGERRTRETEAISDGDSQIRRIENFDIHFMKCDVIAKADRGVVRAVICVVNVDERVPYTHGVAVAVVVERGTAELEHSS